MITKIDRFDCKVLIWRQILQQCSLQKCCCGKFIKPKGMDRNCGSTGPAWYPCLWGVRHPTCPPLYHRSQKGTATCLSGHLAGHRLCCNQQAGARDRSLPRSTADSVKMAELHLHLTSPGPPRGRAAATSRAWRRSHRPPAWSHRPAVIAAWEAKGTAPSGSPR